MRTNAQNRCKTGGLVTLTLLALVSCTREPVSGQDATAATATGRIPTEGFRAAAQRAAPTVVSILSSKTIKMSPEIDPFWDLFQDG